MGRRKIIIEKITNERHRQVTFMKRKNGLIKKATELSVLCDCDVGLIIFSNNRKLYLYSSKDINELLVQYTEYTGMPEVRTNEDYFREAMKKSKKDDEDDDDDDDDDDEPGKGGPAGPADAGLGVPPHPAQQHSPYGVPPAQGGYGVPPYAPPPGQQPPTPGHGQGHPQGQPVYAPVGYGRHGYAPGLPSPHAHRPPIAQGHPGVAHGYAQPAGGPYSASPVLPPHLPHHFAHAEPAHYAEHGGVGGAGETPPLSGGSAHTRSGSGKNKKGLSINVPQTAPGATPSPSAGSGGVRATPLSDPGGQMADGGEAGMQYLPPAESMPPPSRLPAASRAAAAAAHPQYAPAMPLQAQVAGGVAAMGQPVMGSHNEQPPVTPLAQFLLQGGDTSNMLNQQAMAAAAYWAHHGGGAHPPAAGTPVAGTPVGGGAHAAYGVPHSSAIPMPPGAPQHAQHLARGGAHAPGGPQPSTPTMAMVLTPSGAFSQPGSALSPLPPKLPETPMSAFYAAGPGAAGAPMPGGAEGGGAGGGGGGEHNGAARGGEREQGEAKRRRGT